MTAGIVICPCCTSTRVRPHCPKDHPTCDLVVCQDCTSVGEPRPNGRWIDRSEAHR